MVLDPLELELQTVTDELPCGGWELNPNLLVEEQPVLPDHWSISPGPMFSMGDLVCAEFSCDSHWMSVL